MTPDLFWTLIVAAMMVVWCVGYCMGQDDERKGKKS